MKARSLFVIFLVIIGGPSALLAEDNPAVTAINELGLSCLRFSRNNALLSSWSLQQSLGPCYAGAAGETRTVMKKALGYTGDDAKLFEGFKTLMAGPHTVGEGPNLSVSYRSANSLFVSEKLKPRDDWQKLTKDVFASEGRVTDFSNPRGAEKTINDWVKTETRGLIPSILPEGDLTLGTRLVLVNALSFALPWEEQFTKSLTKERAFFVEPKKSKTVPLMFKQHRMRYAHKEGFQIAALPYFGATFQFVVILPDAVDGLAAVEKKLTPQLLAECATLPAQEVRLSTPRLKMQPLIVPMSKVLSELGMGIAFGSQADFSGISTADLTIQEVYHRAFIDMDEDGTKAAAATATVMVLKNGFPHEIPHETVTADHPFIFLIQDLRNGACLFIGRLVDPAPNLSAQETIREVPMRR